MSTSAAAPTRQAVLTPQCMVGQEDYRDLNHGLGCPNCKAPGYHHPQLDMWIDVPCDCPHHQEGQ